MKRVPETRSHRLLPCEFGRGTLVLLPQGDSIGFRESQLESELATVLELVGRPDVANVVVDFAAANYFGTTVISAVHRTSEAVQAKGGRLLLCNTSDDMREVLSVMRLDQLWPIHETRKDALKALE